MQKQTLVLNVTKINKDKITTRSYTNNEGQEVEVKELKIDLVPLKQTKVIHEKDNRQLVKVGFATEPSVKNEAGEWVNGAILGDIVEWQDKPQTKKEVDENWGLLTGEEDDGKDLGLMCHLAGSTDIGKSWLDTH